MFRPTLGLGFLLDSGIMGKDLFLPSCKGDGQELALMHWCDPVVFG